MIGQAAPVVAGVQGEVAPVISGSVGRTGVPAAFATTAFATTAFGTTAFATTGRAGGRVPVSARPPGA